ncbi:hypothetical protein [Cohnella sp. AR92]|uniref:hypothetical protein n=1 Tax=Cohnella sp. AR92 TaxID=648716 RepID=UPI000F8D6913|nr:hypothetical protein [Cohnella sp. AR92]RUS48950.1 hypothetical protein ELR57_00980 [Cohnella sp. AR92]
MKTRGIAIAGVAALALLAGCSKEEENQPAAPSIATAAPTPTATATVTPAGAKIELSLLENAFGFANESGDRLIALQDGEGVKLADPERFAEAIGHNGEKVEIELVGWQDANDQDTNRQTMYNFDNMAGYVYRAKDGKLIPNKSYLLVKDGVVGERSLTELKSTIDEQSSSGDYLPVDAGTIARIEAIKKRKIAQSRLLSESDKEKVALFVFERQGDDMLASIAYVSGDKVLFKDFPAVYQENGTWRVDGADDPGLFEVLFLAHSDEGVLLGMSWGAPEGENLFVLREADGKLQDTDLQNGRYWAPV